MAEKPKFPPFPSDDESQSKKTELEWNKTWIQAAYGQSNRNLVGNVEANRKKFVNLRKYAAGTQDRNKYKNQLASEGNTAQLNLNWDVNTPAPTIIESLVGRLENQGLKIKVSAISPLSNTEYDKEFRRLKAQAYLAKNADKLKAVGINVDSKVDKQEAKQLQDDKTIKLHLDMNFKDSYSTAMQKAIDFVLESNRFPRLRRELLRDLVVCGKGALNVTFTSEYDIQVRVADLVELTSDEAIEDDFSDCKWMGEFIYPTVEDIKKWGGFTKEQLEEVARQAAGKYGNTSWSGEWDLQYYPNISSSTVPYGRFKIKVFKAEYKSQDTYKYEIVKTKGGGEFLRRLDIVDAKGRKKEKKEKDNEVIEKFPINKYKASLVCGTDLVYDYGLCENQQRAKIGNGFHSLDTPFSWAVFAPDIYDMVNKSICEKLIPSVDALCLIRLQSQRVIANMTPQGVAVDASSVAALSNALGESNITPRKIHNIYKQTGDYYYASIDENGDPIMNPNPIRDLPPPNLSVLGALENQASAIIQEMSLVSGVPISTIGAPDIRALVGNEKIAAQNRNDATRVIDDSYRDILERACSQIVLMVQDSIENGGKLDDYQMAIGTNAADTLLFTENFCAMQFGMFIEAAPDIVEQGFFEQSILGSVSVGGIKQSDVFIIRDLAKKDIKYASHYMKACEEAYSKEKMEMSAAQSQAQSQSAAQAAMMAEQAKQQTLQLEYQLKGQYLQLEYQLRQGMSGVEHKEKVNELLVEGDIKSEHIELAIGNNDKVKGDLQKESLGTRQVQVEPRVFPSKM
tara:strand:+ start:6074 stop:8461 length:2388 start_codon:yes stop_codon:yes gene_type:complete